MTSYSLIAVSLVICMYYGNIQTGHGSHGRIGIQYTGRRIVKVYLNGPAAEAGLLPGDVIKRVNAKSIQGPSYTKVNLLIKRGNSIFSVEIERVPWEDVDTKHYVQIINNEDNELDPNIAPETA